jgi:hypothetical protein
MTPEQPPTRLEAAASRAEALFILLLVAGAFTAVTGWGPGIVLMLAGFGGVLAGHLAVGIAAYRRVMSRSWPRVPPSPEDDDDW